MKLFLLLLKNLRRNLLRTMLTSVAIIVLVLVVTLVWTVLWFLDMVTEEKSKDFKAIVTERWQLPSQMPFAYASSLSEGAARHPDDIRPDDSMTWQFYGGTLDPARRTRPSSPPGSGCTTWRAWTRHPARRWCAAAVGWNCTGPRWHAPGSN